MSDNTISIKITAVDNTGPGFAAAIARSAAFGASLAALAGWSGILRGAAFPAAIAGVPDRDEEH